MVAYYAESPSAVQGLRKNANIEISKESSYPYYGQQLSQGYRCTDISIYQHDNLGK